MVDEPELMKKFTEIGCKAINGTYNPEQERCIGKEGEYKFESIESVNFKPHPFTIGPKLVAYASDNFSGMLGTPAIESYEEKYGSSCAYRDKDGKCRVLYSEHTSERAAFLRVKTDKELKEIKELPKFLFAIKPELIKEKIDGIAFLKG